MVFPEILHSMFVPALPVMEKIIRPVIVYLALVVLLRLFGKRELAQLNPFDLVVLLSLSNTVQNAIIGEDNSVSGGLIGAVSLLAVNWLVVRLLFRSRRLTHAVEGRAALLIHNGQLQLETLRREAMTREELLDVIHKNGFEHFKDVKHCSLEPNGSFFMEAMEPTDPERRHEELLSRLDALTREVTELRLRAE